MLYAFRHLCVLVLTLQRSKRKVLDAGGEAVGFLQNAG